MIKTIVYKINGEKAFEDPMIFKRLYAIGQCFIKDSKEYKVLNVKVEEEKQVVDIKPIPLSNDGE